MTEDKGGATDFSGGGGMQNIKIVESIKFKILTTLLVISRVIPFSATHITQLIPFCTC